MMQLEDFKVGRLLIEWREPTVETVQVDEMRCDFEYHVGKRRDDSLRYRMVLTLSIEEVGKPQTEVGYSIKSELIGLFRLPDGMKDDSREGLVRVNGLNLLYGAFRGVLSGITGNFPGGSLILPTIDPRAIVADVENRKRQVKQPGKPKDGSQRRQVDS